MTNHIPDRAPVGQRDLTPKEKKPRKGLKQSRKPRPLSPAEMKALELDVMARDGRCVMTDHTESYCDGKTDAHHVVPQRELLAHYEAGHKVFRDRRNVVALCRHHHNLIERRLLDLPEDALPESLHDFLSEHGFEWIDGRYWGRIA